MRFSRCTLHALYYRWRKVGRNPAGLLLKPHEPRAAITVDMLAGFVQLLAAPGVGSTAAAYRRLLDDFLRAGRIQAREDFPTRLAFEAAIRGPIRADMRRVFRAQAELAAAQEALMGALNGGELEVGGNGT